MCTYVYVERYRVRSLSPSLSLSFSLYTCTYMYVQETICTNKTKNMYMYIFPNEALLRMSRMAGNDG